MFAISSAQDWNTKLAVRVDMNERQRDDVPVKPIDEVAGEAMKFLNAEAGFAQVFTVNRAGFPVGRTMVAVVEPDWSVVLIQRRVHKRIGQMQRHPETEVVWVGTPAPDSINDRPHVYDFGLAIPRVVFIRGLARFMDDEELVEKFFRQSEIQRSKGLTKAPERTRENVLEELIGVVVEPVQVRVEGFGAGAQSFTWDLSNQG